MSTGPETGVDRTPPGNTPPGPPPVVAIVGVPNVGKSTLFNRLVGRRRALVGRRAGLTRDRIQAEVTLAGRTVSLIDTGGIFAGSGEGMARLVRAQAQVALDEADVILLLVSARDGTTAGDRDLAQMLRRRAGSALLVVNKVDHGDMEDYLGEFHALGLGEPIPVSAEHGLGTSTLAERVAELLPAAGAAPTTPEDVVQLAIVGRPNVGKSSLLNALVKEERAIVSETPGTTRDSIDLLLETEHGRYRIIDTAGIRRGGRRKDQIEALSVHQATRSLQGADVALLLLDGTQGITSQDLAVAGLAQRLFRPFLVLVNKWDVAGKEEGARHRLRDELGRRFRFARYAPWKFISARTGLGLGEIFPTVQRVWKQGEFRVGAGVLNRFLERATAKHGGRTRDGAPLRCYYMAQTGVHPPGFTVFTNRGDSVHFSFHRYMENRLREEFDLGLTPIVLRWRRK